QGKLIGVLYLENNLTPHVFTPTRIAVLQLLASQAAISLENGRLYNDLQRENHERQRAEAELRKSEVYLAKALVDIKKSEDQLRIIIDTIPTLAWCTLPDGSVEFINQRWLDYTGLTAEQARDWGWSITIHPEDVTTLMEKWRALLASGEEGS